jgi:5,10-methenyltetrahydromethanopterin hydrogenase
MKQVIIFLSAVLISTTSFADVKPTKVAYKVTDEKASLKVSLQAAGKVVIEWNAIEETTTTAYRIEKSVNGGAFKIVAYLMGETKTSYSYRDKVNGASGNVEYRIVTTDNNITVNTISQNIVIL